MVIGTLAFLLGSLILYRLPETPNPLWGLSLIPLIFLALYRPSSRLPLLPLVALIAGLFWASLHAHFALSSQLDPAFDGEVLEVTGRVVSIPESAGRRLRFLFDLERPPGGRSSLRARISWFDSPERVRAGERWRLTLKLKRPHGFMNPGGFDYEGWLFQQGIGATGYVRSGENRRLERASPLSLVALRQRLGERIAGALEGEGAHAGVLSALAIGHRADIARAQWAIFTATGTSHLIAISGLHVGLVAGFALLLGRWLWSRCGWSLRRFPAPLAGAWLALGAATGYAALAGFSIPTRRALVMVAVAMLALLLRRRVAPSRGLALALALLLIFDPVAVLSPGFWLSFAAVALLLFGLMGGGRAGVWQAWGRAQWLVAVGLAPLLVVWFGQLSLAAPLANIVAVPWVSVAVVPLALAGTLLSPLWESGGARLLLLADYAMGELWPWLAWLAEQPWARWRAPSPPPVAWGLALLGSLLLAAPRAVPQRWLGAVLLLPMVTFSPSRPEPGAYRFTLLDVGQGLSAVVETRRHVLVFDTGPRYAGGFDTGWAVVEPYLRERGIEAVDRLVVSHGAGDHEGGVASLLQRFAVAEVVGGGRFATRPCIGGESWRWDGVDFRVLHPARDDRFTGNDASCVIQVRAAGGSLLLTGDLEAPGERALLSRWGDALGGELLQVPHHGSKSSSSQAFVDAVSPDYALFAVGHRNRFGFPRPEVAERYVAAGSTLVESAASGAVIIDVGERISEPLHWRRREQKLWHSPSAQP